jgi:hypothetical protein
MIDSYSFGSIEINGHLYNSDLIIYPDGRVEYSWRREKGHKLKKHDILDLIEAKPEIIVAGTGAMGCMACSQGLKEYLESMDIELIAVPSEEAVELYNKFSTTKRVGACFHLTC